MQNDKIAILDIIEQTMADGPGLRISIYCAGCPHHCKGCHNPNSWDIGNGRIVSIDELMNVILADEFSNVTFTGGDPLFQVEAFTSLAKRIKTETKKTIWCWTGYLYEDILEDKRLSMILPYIDVLVDGPFIESQKDTTLYFRGSSNHRLIEGTVPILPLR